MAKTDIKSTGCSFGGERRLSGVTVQGQPRHDRCSTMADYQVRLFTCLEFTARPLQLIYTEVLRVDSRRHAVLVDRDARDYQKEIRRSLQQKMQQKHQRHSATVVSTTGVSQRKTDLPGPVLAKRRQLIPSTFLHQYAALRLLHAYSSRCYRYRVR